jgi:SAM-dependent methyltransferase
VRGSLVRTAGLRLMLHVRPPGDRDGDRRGQCSVCGSEARFVRNRWLIPRELLRAAPPGFVDRESSLCSCCGSSGRVRAVGAALVGLYGVTATSVAGLVEEPAFRSLEIAEVNAIGRMHGFLARHPRLTYVEYPREDLHSLSYPDASFDLVLTSDTLEHVEDPRRALREVRRVLRPGGRHVFTVPADPRRDVTSSRSGLPPEHHGRGGGPFALVTRRADLLAHTDFGADVPELLAEAGYVPDVIGGGVDAVYVGAVP